MKVENIEVESPVIFVTKLDRRVRHRVGGLLSLGAGTQAETHRHYA
jgi:hypothetical protein